MTVQGGAVGIAMAIQTALFDYWYITIPLLLFLIYRIYQIWDYIIEYRNKCSFKKFGDCFKYPLAGLAQFIFIASWPIRTVLGAIVFGV